LSKLVHECNGLDRSKGKIRVTRGPFVITELQVSCTNKDRQFDEFKLDDQVNILWQVTGRYIKEG